MPLEGGQGRVLTGFPRPSASKVEDWYVAAIRWTPDGKSLLVQEGLGTDLQEMQLWKISVDGGGPERLDLPLDLLRITFHPDGRSIAYWASEGGSEIWLMEGFPWQDPGR